MTTGNGDEVTTKGGASSQQLARPGPRTPQGKRRSGQNARTPGILADVLQRDGCLGDSQSDFSKLLARLRKHFRPEGFLENVLVAKLAILLLRLFRLYKADLAAAPLLFTKLQAGLREEESFGLAGPADPKTPAPEVLMRYETNIERNIERTLNQLERLQRMRLGQPVPPVKVEPSA